MPNAQCQCHVATNYLACAGDSNDELPRMLNLWYISYLSERYVDIRLSVVTGVGDLRFAGVSDVRQRQIYHRMQGRNRNDDIVYWKKGFSHKSFVRIKVGDLVSTFFYGLNQFSHFGFFFFGSFICSVDVSNYINAISKLITLPNKTDRKERLLYIFFNNFTKIRYRWFNWFNFFKM